MADATPGMTPGPHGVIVVHGIGEGQEKGEFLARVVNGLAESLEESHGVDEKGQKGLDYTEQNICILSGQTFPQKRNNLMPIRLLS